MFRSRLALLSILALSMLAPAPAGAGDKDELEVVGFSAQAEVFAYFTYGVEDGSGFSHAELVALSTKTGKKLSPPSAMRRQEQGTALDDLKSQSARRLGELGLGADPGFELYRNGTSTQTSFTIAGKPYTLRLLRTQGAPGEDGVREDRWALRLDGPGRSRLLSSGGGGFDFGLNSVRLSADGKALAVFLRYSARGFEGPNRRYLAVVARL